MPGTILPATAHHTLHHTKCQEPSSQQQHTTLCTTQNARNHPPSNSTPHSAPLKMPGTILPATAHHILHHSKCQEPSSQQQSTTFCTTQIIILPTVTQTTIHFATCEGPNSLLGQQSKCLSNCTPNVLFRNVHVFTYVFSFIAYSFTNTLTNMKASIVFLSTTKHSPI